MVGIQIQSPKSRIRNSFSVRPNSKRSELPLFPFGPVPPVLVPVNTQKNPLQNITKVERLPQHQSAQMQFLLLLFFLSRNLLKHSLMWWGRHFQSGSLDTIFAVSPLKRPPTGAAPRYSWDLRRRQAVKNSRAGFTCTDVFLGFLWNDARCKPALQRALINQLTQLTLT